MGHLYLIDRRGRAFRNEQRLAVFTAEGDVGGGQAFGDADAKHGFAQG